MRPDISATVGSLKLESVEEGEHRLVDKVNSMLYFLNRSVAGGYF